VPSPPWIRNLTSLCNLTSLTLGGYALRLSPTPSLSLSLARTRAQLVAKIRLEEEKHEDATRKIRECPHLSREELANFRETKRKALLKALEDRNEKLKKFSHINKKALGQFEDFNTQKEELEERKKELDAGAESIQVRVDDARGSRLCHQCFALRTPSTFPLTRRFSASVSFSLARARSSPEQELIQSLDERKDEAINRTFTDVGKYFADVFEELVPHGSGKLKIVRRLAAAADDDGDVEAKVAPSAAAVRVSQFSGIRVLVDFTGGGEEFQMQQLSGGQQTLVALTLIFAIQRCDPAPFYLLDEIDQALDSTHRKAVADLIRRQAVGSSDAEGRPCQFVTSTFHPEQVSIATQWLGVAHQHRVSSIREMQQTAAASFVEKLQQSEGGDAPAGARGRV
jgi:structural maintenance of chromosome 3 (chondroitin sulfate proteoglycan 6)